MVIAFLTDDIARLVSALLTELAALGWIAGRRNAKVAICGFRVLLYHIICPKDTLYTLRLYYLLPMPLYRNERCCPLGLAEEIDHRPLQDNIFVILFPLLVVGASPPIC